MRPALAILLLLSSLLYAEDKVWSAVILANDPAPGKAPKTPPTEIAPFIKQLTKTFGHRQFEIIGSATKSMDGASERWLVPTQNLWLGATSTREKHGYHLKIEFFHDKRRIVETEARLGLESPIFIRGPIHPRGQLIIVFEVRP